MTTYTMNVTYAHPDCPECMIHARFAAERAEIEIEDRVVYTACYGHELDGDNHSCMVTLTRNQ